MPIRLTAAGWKQQATALATALIPAARTGRACGSAAAA